MKRTAESQRKAVNAIVSYRNQHRRPDQIMPNHIICFKPGCFVPQTMCQNYLTPKEKCLYSDILLDVVYLILAIYPENALTVYEKVGGAQVMYRLLTTFASHGEENILLHEMFVVLCEKHVQSQSAYL